MPPVASKFLPCVTLNWPCRVQSRMVPSLHSVRPAMTSWALLLAHVFAIAADHHRDLAFVIELFGDFRTHQVLPRADERVRRPVEHARIFRRVGDIIILRAIGVIDTDAEDFFRRRQRRQQFDFSQRHVRSHALRCRLRLIERLGAKHLAEGVETVQPRAQIDDAVADHGAEARPAAQRVACKTHLMSPRRSLRWFCRMPAFRDFERCVRSRRTDRQRCPAARARRGPDASGEGE